MKISQYIEVIRTEGLSLAHVARTALNKPISACAPWVMADLVGHMGEVHSSWKQIAEHESLTPDIKKHFPPPAPEKIVEWYENGVEDIVKVLSDADPSVGVWTWTGEQDIAWIIRRMAQETAVHAWDARHAIGMDNAIDAELASDGIDEFVHVMLPYARESQPLVGGSVHLHCTDVEGEWLITPGDSTELIVTREHAKGSCAIRGSASDLLLLLWRRLPLTSVEVIGDAFVAERFVAHTSLD